MAVGKKKADKKNTGTLDNTLPIRKAAEKNSEIRRNLS
jgi:hypothetical protein